MYYNIYDVPTDIGGPVVGCIVGAINMAVLTMVIIMFVVMGQETRQQQQSLARRELLCILIHNYTYMPCRPSLPTTGHERKGGSYVWNDGVGFSFTLGWVSSI